MTVARARIAQEPAPSPEANISAQRLFDKNVPWASTIVRNVVRRLPPCFETDDLLQEALMELWKRALLYQENNGRPGKDPKGTPFRAYAYMYVRGACLMSVRRRNWTEAHHQSLATPVLEDRGVVNRSDRLGTSRFASVAEPASPAPDPETTLAEKRDRKNVSGPKAYRRRQRLLREIDKLSPVDAHLITKTYIEERDLDELAKLAGVERTVLSRRLAGIVKRLKKTMATKRATNATRAADPDAGN